MHVLHVYIYLNLNTTKLVFVCPSERTMFKQGGGGGGGGGGGECVYECACNGGSVVVTFAAIK